MPPSHKPCPHLGKKAWTVTARASVITDSCALYWPEGTPHWHATVIARADCPQDNTTHVDVLLNEPMLEMERAMNTLVIASDEHGYDSFELVNGSGQTAVWTRA